MLSAVALLLLSAGPVSSDPLPWIHDDWRGAFARAKAEKKLVAVDVWATWCHTCLSMKNFVLKEAPLGKVSSQHVWLALDYDLEKNSGFFEKYPVTAFPTFLVVDPAAEQVVARWAGSGTAKQMVEFFAAARPAAAAGADAVTLGSRALAKGDYAGARVIYEKALAGPVKDRAVEARLVNGLVEALWKTDQVACTERAPALIDRTDDSIPGLDAVALMSYCASSAPKEQQAKVLQKVRQRIEAAIASPAFAAHTADDRSGVYSILIEAYDGLGQKAEADKATQARLAILEDAAARAKTPADRATFDAHRLECYLRLGKHAEAQKMLEASEKAAPKDFNPPWRLAVLHKARGDHAAGLAAIDRALKLGYGPRQVRLYSTKIDLLSDARRYADARATIAQAKQTIAKIDPKLVRASWIEALDKQAAQIAAKEQAAPRQN